MVRATNSQVPVVLSAASFKDFCCCFWSLGLQVLHHKITPACFSSSWVADSSIHSRSLFSITLYVALCWAQGKWMSQTRWSPSITQGQMWEMDGEASHERLHKVMRYEDSGEKQRAWVAQRRLEDKGRLPEEMRAGKGLEGKIRVC